ncbi:biotin synthesis protein [Beggiatoa sp. PS]|nr:biotin synthesis protein [Beggiatoa sp. PS]
MNSPTHIDKNQVIKSFNRAAPTYEQWSKLQKMVDDSLLERLEWLKLEPQHILDVGGGIGRLSRTLSQHIKMLKFIALIFQQQWYKWLIKKHSMKFINHILFVQMGHNYPLPIIVSIY